MPEGPEIHRAADRLAKVLEGERILRVETDHEALLPYISTMDQATVKSVTCRGKALLTEFSSGLTVYSHNQLYGLWMISPRDEMPETNRRMRWALHTRNIAARLYSATDISVWKTDEINQHPYLARLGPDVLDDSLSVTLLMHRLVEPSFRNRSLASLFLDQKFLAGIGNYLRSEILFTAGCHYDLKPSKMNASERRKLASEAIKISRRSYKTGGVTNLASRARKLKREGSEFEGYRFYVFDRDGEACYHCGDLICREERSSRRIYWCPTCQAL